MREVSAQLKTFLHSNNTCVPVPLYTFKLKSGSIVRKSGSDFPIYWNGNTYESDVNIVRKGIRQTAGIETDTMELDFNIDNTRIGQVGSLSFVQAANQGVLDGAFLVLEIGVMDTTNTVVGTIQLYEGLVGGITTSAYQVKMTVNSILDVLDVELPIRTYAERCTHVFGSVGCGIDTENWKATAIIQEGSTESIVKTNATGQSFANGIAIFESGFVTNIYAESNGVLNIYPYCQNAPIAGETITLYPGCNKSMDTCKNKYNNINRYYGYPFIPRPETIM